MALVIEIKELYCMIKQEGGKLLSMNAGWMLPWIWAFQVSRPPQLLRVSLTIVYSCQDHVLESLFGFFRCDTWLQIFQNDSKICEAEVKLTPLVNKICKLCLSLNIGILTFLSKIRGSAYVHLYKNFGWDRKKVPVSLTCEGDSLMTVTQGSK